MKTHLLFYPFAGSVSNRVDGPRFAQYSAQVATGWARRETLGARSYAVAVSSGRFPSMGAASVRIQDQNDEGCSIVRQPGHEL
jgi:hypothetical protein